MKNKIIGLFAALIAIEILSLIVIQLFLRQSVHDWKNYDLYQNRRLMTWFDKKNSYHPYLTYMSKDLERDSTKKLNHESTFYVGIIGGSFAHYLARYLKSEEGLEKVESFRQSIGLKKNLEFLTLTSGGYQQPQQMLTSVLFSEKADLFISIEGFNDLITQTQNHCVPAHWNYQFVRYHPKAKGLWYLAGKISKGIYQSMAYVSDFTNSVSLFFYFTEHPLLKLISNFQERSLNVFRNCTKKKINEEDMTKKWITDITKHHKVMEGLSKKLITVMQPNQYDPQSKPWSEEEKKLFKPFMWRQSYVEKIYPIARRELKKINNPFFVDMTDVFREETETLYTDGCCHINKKGNKIFAERLFEKIKSKVDWKSL